MQPLLYVYTAGTFVYELSHLLALVSTRSGQYYIAMPSVWRFQAKSASWVGTGY